MTAIFFHLGGENVCGHSLNGAVRVIEGFVGGYLLFLRPPPAHLPFPPLKYGVNTQYSMNLHEYTRMGSPKVAYEPSLMIIIISLFLLAFFIVLFIMLFSAHKCEENEGLKQGR